MIGSKHDIHPSDYSTPRYRADREYTDWQSTPRMESAAEQVVGTLLKYAVGAAAIIVIANIVRVFW